MQGYKLVLEVHQTLFECVVSVTHVWYDFINSVLRLKIYQSLSSTFTVKVAARLTTTHLGHVGYCVCVVHQFSLVHFDFSQPTHANTNVLVLTQEHTIMIIIHTAIGAIKWHGLVKYCTPESLFTRFGSVFDGTIVVKTKTRVPATSFACLSSSTPSCINGFCVSSHVVCQETTSI